MYYNVIKNALFLYYKRDTIAYFYGAKGQKLTRETMNQLIAAEPDYFRQYSNEELERIINFSLGKTGYDCSGFINAIASTKGYSVSLYENSKNKTSPTLGTEGNLLYTTFNNTGRHVGIDIGYGYFIHSPKEGRTLELGKISDYPWEHSGQLAGIDYTGAKN